MGTKTVLMAVMNHHRAARIIARTVYINAPTKNASNRKKSAMAKTIAVIGPMKLIAKIIHVCQIISNVTIHASIRKKYAMAIQIVQMVKMKRDAHREHVHHKNSNATPANVFHAFGYVC